MLKIDNTCEPPVLSSSHAIRVKKLLWKNRLNNNFEELETTQIIVN